MEIEDYINELALKNNWEIRNKAKIVKAKKLLFKDGDLKSCPCDGNNRDRYCGSELCKADVAKDGHCHCRLFWTRNTEYEKL